MKSEYTNQPQQIITGFRKKLIRLRVGWYMAKIVYGHCKNALLCMKTLEKLAQHRKKYAGDKIKKIALVDGKYYWDLYIPGYKSEAITNFFSGETIRTLGTGEKTNRFTNILIAITKWCPLKCEHCFEWDALNGRETLSVSDLKTIVAKFQEKGTGIIQLTGGEPMMKVDYLLEILQSSKPGSEFWVFTSGYNLTPENAQKLKSAGLTGVVVSMDHFNPGVHNLFRGSNKSFDWVQSGVKNAIEAGLVTALSICVSKTFVTESNLMAYADLAKRMGVSFIQILEPRAVGHYEGKDVLLDAGHEKILEEFYLKMNYGKKYRKYPIVCYHGYYQRKTGCFGSGNRSLYVDTDGDLHACPFCRIKMGNALYENLDEAIEELVTTGCHRYAVSNF
jgi:MoaA/NifB/PqqE/SkfB family radical SAM enzyme